MTNDGVGTGKWSHSVSFFRVHARGSASQLRPGHGGNGPCGSAQFQCRGSLGAGVDNRNAAGVETFVKFGRCPFRHGEFRIHHDDDARLNGVEKGVGEGFGGGRQTRDDDISAEVGISFEQRSLSGPAEVGEQEDAGAIEVGVKDEGFVIGLGKTVGGVRVKDAPLAERVAAAKVLDFAGNLGEVVDDMAVNGRAKAQGADADMVDSERVGEGFGAANVVKVAVGEEEARKAVDALGLQEGFGGEANGVRSAAIDE